MRSPARGPTPRASTQQIHAGSAALDLGPIVSAYLNYFSTDADHMNFDGQKFDADERNLRPRVDHQSLIANTVHDLDRVRRR
jgi:hypothetical protein